MQIAFWICRPAAHGARSREPRVSALFPHPKETDWPSLATRLTLSFSFDPEQRLGRCKNTTEPHSFCAHRQPGCIINLDRERAQRARALRRLEAAARNFAQEAVERLLPIHAQHRFVV